MRAPRLSRWALAAVVVAAALNFFLQLGSPNYFVDEALGIDDAVHPLRLVIHAVNTFELTPWTYFLFLHEWVGHIGSQAEFVTRLPSAIAGLLLVAAVFWTARAFVGRAPALGAATLCAISPLVLQYAQEVRVYVFAMLALTLAVGATVRAVQQPARRTLWLAVGTAAAVLSLWLHYADALVIVPLCIWLASRTSLSVRARTIVLASCAAAELLVLPIFIEQIRLNPGGGLKGIAGVNATNLVTLAGTPFDGRFIAGINAVRIIAALVVAASLLRLLTTNLSRIRERRLLCALGLTPIVVLVLLGLAGTDVVSTRYAAPAAPVLLMIVATAITTLNRPLAIPLAALTLFVAGWGVIVSHTRAGFWPPAREPIAYIRTQQQPADVIAVAGRGGDQFSYFYYGERHLLPSTEYINPGDRAPLLAALHQHRRIWILRQAPAGKYSERALLRSEALVLRSLDYHPLTARTWTTSKTTIAYLVAPTKP